MKNVLFFFLALLCPVLIYGQSDDAPDVMFETVLITPENDDPAALMAALAKHNRTHHSEGAHSARVYYINTGPNTGKMVWMMGPCTFADLDTRPECNEDWGANVGPHIAHMEAGEYWELDAELSKLPPFDPNVSPMPIVRVRYHIFKRGISGFRIQHHFQQISETIKSMEGNRWWGVYDNLFQQGYAADARPHMATISIHPNWASLDEGWEFRKHFVAKYGEAAWQPFLDEGNAIQTNSWEEIWEFAPEMAGPVYSNSGGN